MKKILPILLFVALIGIIAQSYSPKAYAQNVNSAVFSPRTPGGYTNAMQIATTSSSLHQIFGYNSGLAQFLHIYDKASAATNGSTPLISFRIYGDANFSLNRDQLPVRFSLGVYICNSTTGPTTTLGAADCLFYSQHNVTP